MVNGMERLAAQYEQLRGLRMRIGHAMGWTRESVNETQLRMMKHCEIPGLLPIETEEIDGGMTFIYDLSGCHRLEEALRFSKWRMPDAMEALCRLAEALEDCRLYLLDADKVLLDDAYIYVRGGEWHDLRFTYLPLHARLEAGGTLEQLIVRWMMKVETLDGQAMQAMLRLVAAPEFVPQALRAYIRQYLAGSPEASGEQGALRRASGFAGEQAAALDPPYHAGYAPASPPPAPVPSPASRPASEPGRGSGWKLLQPPTSDPRTLSELLGDDGAAWDRPATEQPGRKKSARCAGASSIGEANHSAKSPMDPHRRRTLAGGSAAAITAIAWRYAYMDNPGQAGLVLCFGVTIMALAAVLLLWNGVPDGIAGTFSRNASGKKYPHSSPSREQWGGEDEREGFDQWFESEAVPSDSREGALEPAGSRFRIFAPREGEGPGTAEGRPSESSAATTWLSPEGEDRTLLLEDAPRRPQAAGYLIWETGGGSDNRVPLVGDSFVIGRSAEAANHVDGTNGVSRAHAEFVRVSDRWNVKDLGSRNGSRVNGKPLTPYELYPLESGDSLSIASSKYRFVREGV